MKTKKIIICSTSYREYDRRMQRCIKALLDEGHRVYWLSRSYSADEPADSNQINYKKVETKFKKGPLFYLEYNFKLWRLLRKSEGDIVLSVDVDTLIGAYFGCRKSGKRLYFDAHELFHEVPELASKNLKKSIWRQIAKRIIPKVDKAYTVNNSLKSYHQEEYAKTFDVVRNVPVLDKKILVNDHSYNRKVIAYLGVVNVGRGIELMIEALTELTDYHLVILGDGDIMSDCRSLAYRLGVEDRVQFLGQVNPDYISSHLSKCSLAINMAAPISKSYVLSLSNKFFDYMHHHLPSINMDFPEYRNILREYRVGVMMAEYTTANLISAIKRLESPELYNELYKNCQKYKSEYSWQKEKENLLALYR